MAEIVLRVRLITGDHLDVAYEETDSSDVDEVAEHAITTLAADSGMIRAHHGDRVVVLYGRGVAALELAPRGAVL
jgi:allophanate hydrolase subunit 1